MRKARRRDRRHQIEIRRPTEVRNGRGGYTTSWEPIATVFAKVTGLDGRESVMDRALQGISVYQVEICWRGDVLPSDQLRSAGGCFGGREVNVRSAVDPDGRQRELVIVGDTASTRPS